MLMVPPYEPICDISMREFTLKTCFLLAIAMAARCSELHAISYSLLSHTPGWTTVWLQPNVHFWAKNQSSRDPSQQRSFQVKSLCDFAGPDFRTGNYVLSGLYGCIWPKHSLEDINRNRNLYLSAFVHPGAKKFLNLLLLCGCKL